MTYRSEKLKHLHSEKRNGAAFTGPVISKKVLLSIIDILFSFQDIWYLKEKSNHAKSEYSRYLFQRLFERRLSKFGAWIGVNAKFEVIPNFPHGLYGIFISSEAQIGKGCVIFQQVTIGSNTMKDSKGYGYPQIGDNVCIGAGAKIIGGVKIGNNVRVGANCVVVNDIEDNCVVVLEKPRVVKKANLDNRHRFQDRAGNWGYVDSNGFHLEK